MEMMKSLVFLFAGFTTEYAFKPLFDSKSAFDRCLLWACGIEGEPSFSIAVNSKTSGLVEEAVEKLSLNKRVSIIKKDEWTVTSLLEAVASEADKNKADTIIYTVADRPFLDGELSKKILKAHSEYLAEYTSSDGYPLGLYPEVINAGTAKILLALSQESQAEEGKKPVSSNSFFSIMKGDVNAFEIETVMAEKDFRMMRLDFSCSTKSLTASCLALFELMKKEGNTDFSAYNLAEKACKSSSVQKGLPSYYNIQLSKRFSTKAVYNPMLGLLNENDTMAFDKFTLLIKQINDFSESAVVGLGTWTDPLMSSDFTKCAKEVLSYPNLSLLVETAGVSLQQGLLESIAKELAPYAGRINWIISLDAFTPATYQKIHGCDCFAKATETVSVLQQYFPLDVYPQFTRMNINEEELESFYRFWHDLASPSKGKLIIQKYDTVCGLLSDERPADLSPLERVPCWHIKRDMTILTNGDVPICRETFNSPIGNVFKESLEEVWNKNSSLLQDHIKNIYNEKCGNCDEYYTFNF